MQYSNPEIPEGINASLDHPLKEFLWLSAAAMVAIAGLMVVLTSLMGWLVGFVPYAVEARVADAYVESTNNNSALDQYLNHLTIRVAAAAEVPADMRITVHVIDSDEINAFATFGGHVFLLRGLLEKLPNEEALAMLLGHEIAHVINRDPIRSMGRVVAIGLLLSVVSSDIGGAVLDRAIGQGAALTMLKYSRDQERAADARAEAALVKLYGSIGGAKALFQVLKQGGETESWVEFFDTHPRIERRLEVAANIGDALPDTDTVILLPSDFAQWLTDFEEGHSTSEIQ